MNLGELKAKRAAYSAHGWGGRDCEGVVANSDAGERRPWLDWWPTTLLEEIVVEHHLRRR